MRSGTELRRVRDVRVYLRAVAAQVVVYAATPGCAAVLQERLGPRPFEGYDDNMGAQEWI
jgi:hypothetical protein